MRVDEREYTRMLEGKKVKPAPKDDHYDDEGAEREKQFTLLSDAVMLALKSRTEVDVKPVVTALNELRDAFLTMTKEMSKPVPKPAIPEAKKRGEWEFTIYRDRNNRIESISAEEK